MMKKHRFTARSGLLKTDLKLTRDLTLVFQLQRTDRGLIEAIMRIEDCKNMNLNNEFWTGKGFISILRAVLGAERMS